MTWISLFIPGGFLSASSSRQLLCQQSICHLRYQAAFKKGLPTPQENFAEEFRGARINHSAPCEPLVPSCSSSLPRAPPGSASGQGSCRQRGPGSLQGVHVARRPAGGTGGDRCHGGPDLFPQEECKELIVSFPGMDLSLALPRLVERTPGVCACRIVGGRSGKGGGGCPSKPVPQPKFYSAPHPPPPPRPCKYCFQKNSTEAPHSFSLVDCWRKPHLGASLSPRFKTLNRSWWTHTCTRTLLYLVTGHLHWLPIHSLTYGRM